MGSDLGAPLAAVDERALSSVGTALNSLMIRDPIPIAELVLQDAPVPLDDAALLDAVLGGGAANEVAASSI